MTKNTPFRVLYRKFLFSMIDLELLSPQGDMTTLFGQFAALLIFISLLLSIGAFGFWRLNLHPSQMSLMDTWGFQHFLIASTMLVVGLFAVMSWNSTFPDRRDVMVLAPLPVRVRTLFLAKVAAVGTALITTVVMLHFFAGLAWPPALSGQHADQAIPAFTSEPAIAPLNAEEIQPDLDRALAEERMPGGVLAPDSGTGLVIGIVKHGVRQVFSYGAAKPDSIFELGSLTKTFTGLALAQMMSEREATPSEPLRTLLPVGIVPRPVGPEITLMDLAMHRSGLPVDADNIHEGDEHEPYPFTHYDVQDLYAYISRRGVRIPPKVYPQYSNIGFALLGQAMVNRSGLSYPDLLREKITGPLGLEDTVVSMSPDQRRRLLRGFDFRHRPAKPVTLQALAPAGALHSTAGDLLTTLEANLHPEKFDRTMSGALIESRLSWADLRGGTLLSYVPLRLSLAWIYNTETGDYGLGGASLGDSSVLFFNPKGDYAAAVLINNASNGIPLSEIIGEHIRQRLTGEPAISLANVIVPAREGLADTLRWYASYWITMVAAGAFIFCLVLSIQGWAAQLLPRRLFLRVSAWMQLASFIVLITVAFLQPTQITPRSLFAAQQNGLIAWSPTYWFLGLFQVLNGSPALALMARRAWIAMIVVGCSTVAAYALSYFRTMRKIVEEPDILPGSNGIVRLPSFGGSLQTAIVQFSIRTLVRSRRHRVIIAFYLGVGLAITILFLNTGLMRQLSDVAITDPWHEVSLPFLASSILMMGFSIVGIRVTCSMPIDLPANWIFRLITARAGAELLSARRRTLWVLAVVPVWSVWAALLLLNWPWRQAAGHLVVLGLIGVTLAEFCLHGTQKLPFTCSYLPGKSSFHMAFWGGVAIILTLVARGAAVEMHALQGDTLNYWIIVSVLLVTALAARWRTAMVMNAELKFDELPEPAVFALDLHPDGVPMNPTSLIVAGNSGKTTIDTAY